MGIEKSGDEINTEIIIDLNDVKAKVIHLAPNGIVAKIQEPERYKDFLVYSAHVPYFAMPCKELWNSIDGKITKKGLESITSSLKNDFENLERVYKNKKEIKEFYDSVKDENHPALLKEEYDKKKKDARALFKAKKISEKDYQRELSRIKPIKKKYESYDFDTKEKVREFVQQKFKIFVDYSFYDLLINVIEK
jgi:hypothetical protein